MTFYIFHNEPREEYDNFCFFENAFSPEECEQIIALGNAREIVKSKIGGGDSEDIEHTRKSQNSWIEFCDESRWLFDKLSGFVRGANRVRFKFQLTGFMEKLQYTVYDGGGSHYKLHTDFGKNETAQRKLSVILVLSKADEYEGGELEFMFQGARKFDQGTLVVFPSFEVHGVRPVTSGTRRSLVAWVSGEPFR